MKIYFEDGELITSKYLPFGPHYTVDATKGVSKNIDELEYFNYFCPNVTVYTNSIFAFSNEYAWNEELKVPEIYIRAGEHMIFTRIDALTTRELRQGHNLAHMYVAGEFEKGVKEYK
jgi:hypothetical protein